MIREPDGPAPFSRTLIVGLLGAFVAVHSPANARGRSAETVEQASRSFDDAQYRRDVRRIAGRLAPGMVYISGSGRVGGSREFIAAFSDADTRFDPFVITDRRLVQLRPDVVVVTGEGRISGQDASGRFSEHFRYSDTFARSGSGWHVVYVQVTKLP